MKLTVPVIKQMLSEINSEEDRARRLNEIKNYNVYEGQLHDYVEKELIEKYPKTWKDYTVADYNLLKKITDKKSVSYKKKPLRSLDSESETKAYNDIVNKYKLDSVMKLIDRYKNQHRYCAVGVMAKPSLLKDGTTSEDYSFWALAPYDFCVHRDVNGEIYGWSIPTGKTKEGDVWTMWTNESHIKIVTKDYKDFLKIEMPGSKEKNPWGIMPFIYVPLDASGEYPYRSSLVAQTIKSNFNLSVYLTSGNQQIGQLVLRHPKAQKFENVTMGLRTAMTLPQEGGDKGETTAEYIAPSPNLDGHKDSVVTYMAMVLDEHGITSSKIGDVSGEKFASGFDRLIANADVQDIIEDNQGIYKEIENEIYNIVKKITLARGKFIFRSEKLKITFSRPQILLSDSELLDNLKKKKDLGLWDEWELVQEANPNLSEAEAKLLVETRASRALDGKNVFNGAQVTSLVEVVAKVGLKEIPRESGVQILIASFGVSEELAEKIIPSDSFTPNVSTGAGNANF